MGEVEMVARILPEMRIRPTSRQLEIGRNDKASTAEAAADQSGADGLLPASPRKLDVAAIEALRASTGDGETAESDAAGLQPETTTFQERSET